jgi:hypothetical protein
MSPGFLQAVGFTSLYISKSTGHAGPGRRPSDLAWTGGLAAGAILATIRYHPLRLR